MINANHADSTMDKIITIKHHTTAQSLLLSVSEDHGNPTLRLWNTATALLVLSVPLPPGAGIFSAAFTPDSTLVAIGTKSKTILVLDPRSPSNILSIPAHDSLRPIHVAWLSSTHFVSTGFSKSASRELFLYSVDSVTAPTVLRRIAQQTLDVSPAPLFPLVDLDTSIIFLYSKGERTCSAFEVDLEAQEPSFSALPPFGTGSLARKLSHTHGMITDYIMLIVRFFFLLSVGFSFLPKRLSNIKQCEILSSLRLTATTIEVVSFTIPKAKLEYFQDDIFIPTRDVEHSTLSAEAWIEGGYATSRLIDLRPHDMLPREFYRFRFFFLRVFKR